MSQILSTFSNALKVRYIGQLRPQLNNATVLLSKIGRQDQMVSGKDFTVPLHTGRNLSAGTGLPDYGDLPTPDRQKFQTTVVPNRYTYGTLRVSGPTIAASRDNVGAFVEALSFEVEKLQLDMKRDLNRQLNGDGTGALAYWTGADDTTPATVDDGQGNAFVHLPAGTAMSVDIVDASDHSTLVGTAIPLLLGAKGANSYSVSWASGTISGTADGDYAVRAGTHGHELMGIAGIISASDPPLGDLQGIDATTHPFWQAQAFLNGGTKRPIAFEDMQEVIDTIAANSDYGESDVAFFLSNYPVRRAYYKLCIAERMHMNTMKFDGGFNALSFNGINFFADPQAKRNVLYYINPDTMKIFRTSDFDWMDKDGSYLSRTAGKDAYEATLFHYGNLACLTRNGNGLLADLVD